MSKDELAQTFELTEVKQAIQQLISDNAEYLIHYIYSHTDQAPYDDARVRVGLVLKILLRSGNVTNNVSSDVVDPAIDDLQSLMTAERNPEQRRTYSDEIRFLKHCTILDDMITLNTQRN